MNGWVLTRIQKVGFILRWSSYSTMNPVYETDLRSLECRQILNSLQVCHSGFLRNEPTYQSFQRHCVICQLISIRFTLLTRVLLYIGQLTVFRGTQRQFSENICPEDEVRSRIFGTSDLLQNFLLACLSQDFRTSKNGIIAHF